MSWASDNFTGTDGNVLPTYSANWTRDAGAVEQMQIISNAVRATNTGSFGAYAWNAAQATNADYDVQATIFDATAGNSAMPGIMGRMTTTTSGDGYGAYYIDNATGWELWKRVSGSYTTLGNYVGDNPTTSRTVILRFSGTTISVHIGGVQRISVTDSAHSGKGYAGVFTRYGAASNSRTLDTWSASDPAASFSPKLVVVPGRLRHSGQIVHSGR
jgi:hypothetical protein